jgi:predicted DsbA family dithiol-disulfide isomerase
MADPATTPLVVDVISDVVCPWCFVGKRRLEQAIGMRSDRPVAVRWHPFQLDPTIPPEGMDRRAYMERKFGAGGRLAEIHARLAAIGAEVGIDFAFEAIRRSPNTRDAHRLIRLAAVEGLQGPVAEALFAAYFEQGLDIGDRAVLADIGERSGLDRTRVETVLAGEDLVAEVEGEIRSAQEMGVQGVPFFIIAGRYAVSGAEAAETLAGAMDKAAEEIAAA